MIDEKLFKKAFEDESFKEKLSKVESRAELKDLFAEKDILLTDEEISELCEELNKSKDDNEELSEENLDDVAGGSIGKGVIQMLGWYLRQVNGPLRPWL